MSRPTLSTETKLGDFWDEMERSPADGTEITHADCAWIAHEAAYASITAHPNKEAQRRWLLVARTMADKAIEMLNVEIEAEKKETA